MIVQSSSHVGSREYTLRCDSKTMAQYLWVGSQYIISGGRLTLKRKKVIREKKMRMKGEHTLRPYG